MRLLKSISTITFLLLLGLFVYSCSGGNSAEGGDAEATEVKHGEGKAYNSAYVCPMHCEGSGSEEAGNCPACGMAYVASSDHMEDGHTHEE